MVIMVCVLVGLCLGRLRTPLLTPSGRRNRASWASQPQKSVTLRHSQRADHKVHENMWWHWEGGGGPFQTAVIYHCLQGVDTWVAIILTIGVEWNQVKLFPNQ
jgi:hypothetical protein